MLALLRAAHPGPTVTVTAVAALLAVAADLDIGALVLVVAAVMTGQLSIGWSNDLVDADRDRAVARQDKPVAAGEVSTRLAWGACALALVATTVLSLAAGPAAGVVHLVLVVGSGWAYNLWLKRTLWSWLPYAVAFGALPGVINLAATPSTVPPLWMPLTGALLGVGAHLVNALPDLAADARTGVRALPHRLGPRLTPPVATATLLVASLVVLAGPPGAPGPALWAGLVAVAVLALVALRGRGRTPFRAAMAIALVDVLMWTATVGGHT